MIFNISIFLSVSTNTGMTTSRIDETIYDPETIISIINTINNDRYTLVEKDEHEGTSCFLLHYNHDDICWNLYMEYIYDFTLKNFVPDSGNYIFCVDMFGVKKRDIEKHVKMGKDIF